MRTTISIIPESTYKRAKRVALTILFCIPVVAVFGYFTRNIITNNALQIVCFTLIMGVAVFLEELIYSKRQKKLEEKKKDNKHVDVFK